MAKICIAIGEGASEREFLTALIRGQYKFQEFEQVKGSYIYKKDETYWLTPYPPHLTSRSGQSRLVVPDTYKALRRFYDAHTFLFGTDTNAVEYLVLRDGDYTNESKRTERFNEINNAMNGIVSNSIVHMPHGTIENWYLAGLTEAFEFFDRKDVSGLAKLLSCDVESCVNAKEKLDSVLVENISGARTLIGQEVGSVFSVEQAVIKSPTFCALINKLTEKGLL